MTAPRIYYYTSNFFAGGWHGCCLPGHERSGARTNGERRRQQDGCWPTAPPAAFRLLQATRRRGRASIELAKRWTMELTPGQAPAGARGV